MSGVNHFGCCLCLTHRVFKGRCLSTISINIDVQKSNVSLVSSKILIISYGADCRSFIKFCSLKVLKDL